ncbi:MAG: HTH domain-containing protein [Oligoflexia bacterium]|nr:HTH domain-containing protein [Oligoflexia bacterium]
MSSRSEQILGLKSDLDGYFERFLSLIIPEHKAPFLESVDKAVRESSDWRFEGILVNPSNKKIWFSCFFSPTVTMNEVVFDGTVQDITEHKFAEEQIKSLNAELELRVLERTESLRIANDSLEEKNIVLNGIIKLMEENKSKLYHRIKLTVDNYITPYVNKISSNPSIDSKVIKNLENGIGSILDSLHGGNLALKYNLTAREYKMAKFLYDDYTAKEISNMMNISEHTVRGHIKKLKTKLKLKLKSVVAPTKLKFLLKEIFMEN